MHFMHQLCNDPKGVEISNRLRSTSLRPLREVAQTPSAFAFQMPIFPGGFQMLDAYGMQSRYQPGLKIQGLQGLIGILDKPRISLE